MRLFPSIAVVLFSALAAIFQLGIVLFQGLSVEYAVNATKRVIAVKPRVCYPDPTATCATPLSLVRSAEYQAWLLAKDSFGLFEDEAFDPEQGLEEVIVCKPRSNADCSGDDHGVNPEYGYRIIIKKAVAMPFMQPYELQAVSFLKPEAS